MTKRNTSIGIGARACPFCQERSEMTERVSDKYPVYVAGCPSCGARGGAHLNKNDALNAWRDVSRAVNGPDPVLDDPDAYPGSRVS